MPRGGRRPNAGRPSHFSGLQVQKAFTLEFTSSGRIALDRLASATALSRAAVMAVLVDQFASVISFRQTLRSGPQFPNKSGKQLPIRMTAEVGQKFRDAHDRTGKSYSDIAEGLVLWFGDKAVFPVPKPKPTKSVIVEPSAGDRPQFAAASPDDYAMPTAPIVIPIGVEATPS